MSIKHIAKLINEPTGVEVLHGPILPRVVGSAYRPWAPRDGVCMQQLVDDGGLRLAGLPQPPDPVAAEKLGDGPLPGHI